MSTEKGLSNTLLPVLVVSAPVAVVTGHQAASNEQDQVDKPPNSQAAQGEQLPDSCASVAQAETIDPKTTQEKGVQQRGDEVVSGVSVQKQQRTGTLEQLDNTQLELNMINWANKINHEHLT